MSTLPLTLCLETSFLPHIYEIYRITKYKPTKQDSFKKQVFIGQI